MEEDFLYNEILDEERMECKICYEYCKINSIVKLEPCGHQLFCKECIEKLAVQKTNLCPLCREECSNIKKHPSLSSRFWWGLLLDCIVPIFMVFHLATLIKTTPYQSVCVVALVIGWLYRIYQVLREGFRKIVRVYSY